MKKNYQFAYKKPDEKRKPGRRKQKQALSLENAASKFLQEITPLLK